MGSPDSEAINLKITRALTDIFKDNPPKFYWGPEKKDAVQRLKHAFTNSNLT